MAKNKDEAKVEIERVDPAAGGALAIAGADDFFATPTVSNAEAGDRIIPVLHMYQGTSAEAEEFGPGFVIGDLIDKIEKRKVASREVAVVLGKKWWKRWEQGNKAPVYSYDKKADVPAGDTEWTDGPNGTRVPPRATEVYEFMVLVVGETFPYVLRFKRTSIDTGKLLNTLCENAKAKRRIARYELGFNKEKNDKGVFAVPTVRDVGDADEATKREVVGWFTRLSKSPGSVKVQGDEPVEPSGVSGGAAAVKPGTDDEIPI